MINDISYLVFKWWKKCQYKGKFNQKGEPHDSQAQVKINKNRFKGKIENGLLKQGEFYMGQSLKTYKGSFERFLASGYGILQGEKQIFQGKWKAGKFIYGTYTIKQNGKHILVYRGQFQNWKFHGIGVYYDLDNELIYRGQFKQGEKSGYGKLSLLKERWELQGEFRNNQFEQGTHIVYQQPTLKNNEENTRTIVGQVIFQRLQITKVQSINHELVEQLKLNQKFDRSKQRKFRNNQSEQDTNIVYQEATLKNNDEKNTRLIVGQIISGGLQIIKVQRINHKSIKQLDLNQSQQLIPQIYLKNQTNRNNESSSRSIKNNSKYRTHSTLKFKDLNSQLQSQEFRLELSNKSRQFINI